MRRWIVGGLVILSLAGCARKLGPGGTVQVQILPGQEVVEQEYGPWRTAHPLLWRLIHIDATLRPELATQNLYGRATLYLVPHFYPMDTLRLDAKQMVIDSIRVVSPSDLAFTYTYDSVQIRFQFSRPLRRGDTLVLTIGYHANFSPTDSSGEAIAGDRGFYFIDPLRKDPYIPTHLWTQGETEWNSRWLPLIDKPNQKLTQHICITVEDTTWLTLSNGLLQWQTLNADGSRTDCWTQTQPHAPYLIFVGAGPYVKVVDTPWQGKEVSYYVFQPQVPIARQIYRHTRQMLTFFSERLGFPFPWDKYAQMGVYHFTAGAMENTSSVLFGARVHMTPTDLRQESVEATVAHELFHHWFGDLVTCEDWSQLPLNESFADFSEFLWYEYKYGEDTADYWRLHSLWGYLYSSLFTGVHPLIHYRYTDAEAMFDAHSYNKGGAILNYMRFLAGDSAFFAALSYFLHQHAYQPVEVHQLRLAFEEVTGLDWLPFFNDWFFKPGHPELHVQYQVQDTLLRMQIRQVPQPRNQTPWHIRLHVAVRTTDTLLLYLVEIQDTLTTWVLPVDSATLQWADLDYEQVLVGAMEQEKPLRWWRHQAQEWALPARVRRRAYRALFDMDLLHWTDIQVWLQHEPFSYNRAILLRYLYGKIAKEAVDTAAIERLCIQMAYEDPAWEVRRAAVRVLRRSGWYQADSVSEAFRREQVPAVRAQWLYLWKQHDSATAYQTLYQWTAADSSRTVWNGVRFMVKTQTDTTAWHWMTAGLWRHGHDYWVFGWYNDYLEFLAHYPDTAWIKRGLDTLARLYQVRPHPYNRSAIQVGADDFLQTMKVRYPVMADYFRKLFPFVKEDGESSVEE